MVAQMCHPAYLSLSTSSLQPNISTPNKQPLSAKAILRTVFSAPSRAAKENARIQAPAIKAYAVIPFSGPSPQTFHGFPCLPAELQLLILSHALSAATSSLFVRRYRFSYGNDKASTETFKVNRYQILKHHGIGTFLSVNRVLRQETLKFLEARPVSGEAGGSIVMDRRRKHSTRWKEAVYLLHFGNGQELEAEQEEQERMVSEES